MIPQPPLGRIGEALAVHYLARLGYRIVVQNWRAGRQGEIDIVALAPPADAKELLVLVEVKSRHSYRQGHPLEAVTPRKQARLLTLAEAFLAEHPEYRDCQLRFDVIAVAVRDGGEWLEHLENAFGFDG